MHSRRALLYMPGDDWKKITKALTLGVDCICMDMEDGVAVNRKTEARAAIAKALRELDFGRSEKLARINAVGSGMEQEDIEALRKESEFGAQLGFTGKQIIHPAQVEPVQAAFTPNDDAIAHAKRIVDTFEASQKAGKGAYALDGKMIDMPLVKNAQKVLDRAKAAGKI